MNWCTLIVWDDFKWAKKLIKTFHVFLNLFAFTCTVLKLRYSNRWYTNITHTYYSKFLVSPELPSVAFSWISYSNPRSFIILSGSIFAPAFLNNLWRYCLANVFIILFESIFLFMVFKYTILNDDKKTFFSNLRGVCGSYHKLVYQNNI